LGIAKWGIWKAGWGGGNRFQIADCSFGIAQCAMPKSS
jgi:hypothetical protein